MDENTNITPENNNVGGVYDSNNVDDKQNFIKTTSITLGILILLGLVGVLLIHVLNSNKSQDYTVLQTGDILQDQNTEGSVGDTQTNTNSTVISTNTGTGIDTAPSESTSKDCSSGRNDDYLHPERFINPDGTLKCADGVVIFDHQITPKFIRTIIPYVKAETGDDIDLDLVDFYITLPATGEEVVYKDIFNWYVDGKRTIFNTNELLWEKWGSYIGGSHTYDFGVKMIHRPTGADISIIFKDHTTMTLYFDGLNGS